MPPVIAADADSAFAVDFASALRDRLAGRVRRQMRVIETEQYCEALEASGFACAALLDLNSSEQLARFLQADSYVVSWLSRDGGEWQLKARAIDLRRSGFAGWLEASSPTDMGADDFAKIFADSLRERVNVADEVRGCLERRDRSDFRGAKDRAYGVFEEFPNHPAAAQCLATVAEASQEPADSSIIAYRMAVVGDSLCVRCWAALGRLQLQVGDTTGSIDAFEGQLRAEPDNGQLRTGLISQRALMGDYDGAVRLAEEGAALDPASTTFLNEKFKTCRDGEMWDCVLEAADQQYAIDESVAEDEGFLQSVIGAAGLANDTPQSIKWTGIGVTLRPAEVAYRTNHASALRDAGMTDSAIAVYESVVDIDPMNFGAPVAIAQLIMTGFTIDSTMPLDTATMDQADSILSTVAERAAAAPQVLENVAALYFQTGAQLAQVQGFYPDRARVWLTKALDLPLNQRFQPQANFFLGYATLFHLQNYFAVVRDAEDCAIVDTYDTVVQRGRSAIQAGASLSADGATRILESLDQYAGLTENFRQAFQCTEGN